MNRKIKKIITLSIAISSFSTVIPTINFMTAKAYASTSDTQLNSIYLSDGSINFSSSTYSYTVKVDSYVKEISISAKPENTDSTVEIDGTIVGKSDHYRQAVSLEKGENTIKIKVKDADDHTKTYILTVNRGTSSSKYDNVYLKSIALSDGDIDFDKNDTSYNVKVNSSVDRIDITAKPEYSGDIVRINGSKANSDDNYRKTVNLDKGKNEIDIDVYDCDSEETRTYKLNITRGNAADDQSDIYLDSLSVDGSSISLSDDKTIYDVNVNEEVNEVDIKAEPPEYYYNVTINGSKVDQNNKYKKTIDLNKGKNEIKIKLEENNNTRIYTLNITRGTITTSSKVNQWVEANGQMQYNDASGNPLKNAWLLDKNVAKYYYLDYNGYKVTGWKYDNSHWYLLDQTGVMQTGWQYTNGAWYYFDGNGAMRTGWLIDGGKYYYFNSNGSMAYNTNINGYTLGSDGAWNR